jgi:hypothetical protein
MSPEQRYDHLSSFLFPRTHPNLSHLIIHTSTHTNSSYTSNNVTLPYESLQLQKDSPDTLKVGNWNHESRGTKIRSKTVNWNFSKTPKSTFAKTLKCNFAKTPIHDLIESLRPLQID